MAKVPLRVYNLEIESMIEGGHLEEAIAHSQHILRTFPMHIETYRLLGKSFLEARRYTDAADIFQRALMAVPDDFVSHVGMSIIRDDEGKLDDSIWHMERAFESQPSNPAIQSELRRLYGRRDGVEPPKIRLSRDALANMYAQGELFNQAIAEIRAVLAEDGNRPDLQVMLARAYYRSGQKVEAAEMAANLLKKYAYCLDALRILVDVLPGNAGAENAQVYRQRLNLIDPYSAFATDSVFNSYKAADTAVNIEKLEYSPSSVTTASQPDWASSLGIKLTDDKHAEPAPVWMKKDDSGGGTSEASPRPIQPVNQAADDQTIPDWMRGSGWQESSGTVQEAPIEIGIKQSDEQLAKADIPDWLKAMAPKEIAEADASPSPSQAELPASNDLDIPDWLAGIGIEGTDAKESTTPVLKQVPPSEKSDIPEWLNGMESIPVVSSVGSEAVAKDQEEKNVPQQEMNVDALEKQNESNHVAISSRGDDSFPDWLADMDEVTSDGTAAAMASTEIQSPTTSDGITEPTPTIKSPQEPVVPATTPDEEYPFEPSGETKPVTIEDDTMAWLESLAAKQGANEEELLIKPEDRSEEMPEWLRLQSQQTSGPANPEPVNPSPEALPEAEITSGEAHVGIKNEESTEEIPPLSKKESTDIPEWLKTAPEPTSLKESIGAAEIEALDQPGWLHSTEGQPPETIGKESSPRIVEEHDLESISSPTLEHVKSEPDLPKELQETGHPDEGMAGGTEEEETLTWLRELEAKQDLVPQDMQTDQPEIPGVEKEIKTPTRQEDITITSWLNTQEVKAALGKNGINPDESPSGSGTPPELPDWLKELEKSSVEETTKPPEALPDWLRQPVQLSDNEPVVPSGTDSSQEAEIPVWTDEEIPVSDQAAATTHDEWVPMDEKPETGEIKEQAIEPALEKEQTPDKLGVHKPTGILARIPAREPEAETLVEAQTALNENRLSEAMQEYASLIKKKQLLDEVIHDLREAIYRFPVDIIVWQTLGDACMRANRLQDALDAYTKAEELLRY